MYAQENNSLPVWIILSPAHHHISINSQPFLVGIVSISSCSGSSTSFHQSIFSLIYLQERNIRFVLNIKEQDVFHDKCMGTLIQNSQGEKLQDLHLVFVWGGGGGGGADLTTMVCWFKLIISRHCSFFGKTVGNTLWTCIKTTPPKKQVIKFQEGVKTKQTKYVKI